MDIKCPHCGRVIQADDVNVQTSIAKCRDCNAVFGFAAQVGGTGFTAPGKRAVDMPDDYTLATEGADLVLVRRWFNWKFMFLLLFCVAWDSFLVFWYVNALKHNGPWLMVVFPIAHVAVGVGLTYFTVAGFVNRTRVTVNQLELRVKHYPLPWPGNRTLQRQEIDQLFCEEKLNNSRNGSSYTYGVSVVMPGGKRIKLVSGLDTPEDALFLEQKIEGYLGITDRPVAGEMRPI
jgi:hypothetical protein